MYISVQTQLVKKWACEPVVKFNITKMHMSICGNFQMCIGGKMQYIKRCTHAFVVKCNCICESVVECEKMPTPICGNMPKDAHMHHWQNTSKRCTYMQHT